MAVIAVCCEVLSPDLLNSWVAQGWMPNLERLRRAGTWSRLRSDTELSSGSIWPTFFTGVNPGTHGQFFTHMQLRPGSYEIVKKYADDVPCEPFWARLERAGRSSAIIDVPQTRPVEPFRGIHIAGWGGEYPAWPRSSSPAELMREIIERFGTHPLADQYRVGYRPRTEEEHRRLIDDLLDAARTKSELSRWVFDQGPQDLFLTVFAESHWALHLLWEALDEGHPQHEPVRAEKSREMFRELGGILDSTIGALHEARSDADVIVFSLSGMGPNYSGWHVLPAVLERLSMGPQSEWPNSARAGAAKLSVAERKRGLERLTSFQAVETLKRMVPVRLWDRWTRRILHAGNRWKHSRAFCLPNDYSGAIRINLQGREPCGLVAPGADYRAVCDEITTALLELEHVQTGRPVVREVIRTQDHYHGAQLGVLPDLVVVWANEEPVTKVRSARLGSIELESPERRTGGHRPEGFLIASGPRLKCGVQLDGYHILDLAPTLLHLLGVPAPREYDGRVIPVLA